jgi:GNAT superfamily N-acetyltransferase
VIRTATPADLPLIRQIVSRSNDAPYAISTVLEEKCFGDGYSGKANVRLLEDAGVAVTCGKFLRLIAVDRARRRKGIGSRLLHDSGASVAFAEPGNYFTPGVVDSDLGTLSFLRARGFVETGATWNLVADTGAAGAGGATVRTPPPSGVIEFVRREFGAIWAFEVARAGAVATIEGVGFAAIEANNRGLGTFGPAGVAKSERGKGVGRTLLLAALAELRRLGFSRAIIPWTDAIDFYRKSCGAEPAHRFVTMARTL